MTNSLDIERTSPLERAIQEDRQRSLDWRDKSVQPGWYGSTVAQVVAGHHTIDTLSTPMMTLDRQAIEENKATMGAWCKNAALSLAPHGKTTMAPQLWHEQLNSGCWAITVANEPQLRVARGAGVSRVIVANLFLRPEGLTWLSRQLDADDTFEVYCWVDSVEAVLLMDETLRSIQARRPIPVLIEVGHHHARTGARSLDQATAVAEAVKAATTLALAGVSGFEGSVAHDTDDEGLATVDRFLKRMVDLHHVLLDQYEVDHVLLSAGGSAFFDRVATVLGPEGYSHGQVSTRVVLRSGAYIVHDDGFYRRSTPHTRGTGPAFHPAMHVWTRVISTPEPGLVYLDAGKRDLPFDQGLPELQLVRKRHPSGPFTTVALTGHEMFDTSDQHAHVKVPEDSPLRIGDLVRLGLSHPCTAFDKWTLIPVVDSASAPTPVVIDLVRTYF